MKSWRRKRMRAQLEKARTKAQRLRAAGDFRAAYERLLFDKGQAVKAELGEVAPQPSIKAELAEFMYGAADADVSVFFNPAKRRK